MGIKYTIKWQRVCQQQEDGQALKKKIEEENLNEIFEEHRRNCNETEQNEYN